MMISKYQQLVAARLAQKLATEVRIEWGSMRKKSGLYSPRLDIAVGPFAIDDARHIEEFDRMQIDHRAFLQAIHELHVANIENICNMRPTDLDSALARNRNSRCFLGIEVEHKVSRKHLMGGAINAAALGRIGLAIGWTMKQVATFARLWNCFDTSNLFILSAEQFLALLDVTHTQKHNS